MISCAVVSFSLGYAAKWLHGRAQLWLRRAVLQHYPWGGQNTVELGTALLINKKKANKWMHHVNQSPSLNRILPRSYVYSFILTKCGSIEASKYLKGLSQAQLSLLQCNTNANTHFCLLCNMKADFYCSLCNCHDAKIVAALETFQS